jgi:hypothetical protein
MSGIASASGRLHSEFVRLLFLQAHRETDCFFAASGVRLVQYIVNLSDFYSYRLIGKLTAFLQLQEFDLCNLPVTSSTSAARLSLSSSREKLAWLSLKREPINLNLDGAPITSKSHTHPSHSQTSRLLTSSLSLGVPVPRPT